MLQTNEKYTAVETFWKNVGWRENLKVEYCLKIEDESDDIVIAPAVHFQEDVYKIFAWLPGIIQ